ncbi:YhfC family intramembrane metalloprotease [Scopulibacillus daqui]|nr:YhfC family intramembrane metalloprotease [Scopulibacillus daqui]
MIVVSILVPIGSLIYLKKRVTMIPWKPVLIGVLIFIVFSQMLEKFLNVYILNINPYTSAWFNNPYLYALYGGLAAGIFEELGRFIGFYYLLKNDREWKHGIAYGIGHGGIESILIGVFGGIQFLTLSFLINSGQFNTLLNLHDKSDSSLLMIKEHLINQPTFFLLGGIERIFSFVIQLSLSLLVLYAIRNKKIRFLLYAILIHTSVDFFALISQKFQLSPFFVEGILFIMMIFSWIHIIKSKLWFSKTSAGNSNNQSL